MRCCDCGEDKPLSAFNAKRKYCKGCQSTRNREYRLTNHVRIAAGQKRWQETIPVEVRRQKRAEHQVLLKAEVIYHYGGLCSCCGENQMIFLSIDHVDGGGNEHRREIGQGGLYYWLKRNDWPSGFDVLCHNCNWAKAHGGCPHQTAQKAVA